MLLTCNNPLLYRVFISNLLFTYAFFLGFDACADLYFCPFDLLHDLAFLAYVRSELRAARGVAAALADGHFYDYHACDHCRGEVAYDAVAYDAVSYEYDYAQLQVDGHNACDGDSLAAHGNNDDRVNHIRGSHYNSCRCSSLACS
jgi:hypothetical protein